MVTDPEKMSDLISKVSKNFFLDGSFEISETPKACLSKVVHKHFVSNILICNNHIRMIYKVHYNHANSFKILSEYLKSEVTNNKIDDFFRELCNLIGGRVKQLFQEYDFTLGISIPLTTDGFDELYFPVSFSEMSGEYFWSLKKDKNEILMSLYVEVLQPNALDSLNLTEIDVTATDEDDMEFF